MSRSFLLLCVVLIPIHPGAVLAGNMGLPRRVGPGPAEIPQTGDSPATLTVDAELPDGVQVMRLLGPAAEHGLSRIPTEVTVTRTVRAADGKETRWVERHVHAADLVCHEVLEPFRMGYKRERGRSYLVGSTGEWVETPPVGPHLPIEQEQPMAAPAARSPVTPSIDRTVRRSGPHSLIVTSHWIGGLVEEWDLDWSHKVITGRRMFAPNGTLQWEEAVVEVRRDGARWIQRRERRYRDGSGEDFEETWAWQDWHRLARH